MWIGAFYSLLIYGRFWIPAITDSFELIGQTASGTGPMAPSDVFTRGIDIAGALMATSSTAAFFTNLGTSLAMIFTGIITAMAFIAITVQFVVAMVESYIIVAAGFIFVGFGGSRWTAPYVERYIGLGVATGVKIMLLYLLIGTGHESLGRLDDRCPKHCRECEPGHVGSRNHGRFDHLHDAVLADSQTLRRGAGRFARTVRRRSGFKRGVRRRRGNGCRLRWLLVPRRKCAGLAVVGRRRWRWNSRVLVGCMLRPRCSRRLAPTAGEAGPFPRQTSPSTRPSGGSSQPAAPMSDAARNLSGMQRRISSQVPPDSGPHATPPRLNIDHNE